MNKLCLFSFNRNFLAIVDVDALLAWFSVDAATIEGVPDIIGRSTLTIDHFLLIEFGGRSTKNVRNGKGIFSEISQKDVGD